MDEQSNLNLGAVIKGPKVHVRLFDKAYESFVLLLPVLLFLVAIFQLNFYPTFTLKESSIANFIAWIVGLDVIHLFFSFSLILNFPEFQLWIRKITNDRPWLFWIRCLLFFVLTFVLTLAHYRIFKTNELTVKWIIFTVVFATVHHDLSQRLGLLQVYSVKALAELNFNPAETQRALRAMKLERFLKISLLSSVFFVLLFSGKIPYMFFPKGYAQSVLNVADWGIRVSVIGIILNSLFFPKVFQTNKFWFSLRFLWALTLYPTGFFFFYLGNKFLHGFEYLGVYRNMVNASSAGPQQKKRNFLILMCFCVLGLVLAVCRKGGILPVFFLDASTESKNFVRWLSAFAMSMSLSHFFIDGLIFRMKNRETREILFPLLLGLSFPKSEKLGEGLSPAKSAQ